MADMTNSKLALIQEQIDYFDSFFEKHPEGIFEIKTQSPTEGRPTKLNLYYDTKKAPFETDMGRFDDDHKVKVGDYNFEYVNIPGGETFAAPNPLASTYGEFWAEGLFFTVHSGNVVDIQVPEGISIDSFELSQKELINLVRSGRSIPVAELGLGFYKLAGIKTYSDSSILSREKTGPHLGLGTNASPNSEQEMVKRFSKGFYHTDFLLDNAELVWVEPLNKNLSIIFYPPVKW